MLGYALIVFAIGALGGIALASFVLRGRLAPWPLSLLHAALGAIGLIIVLYAALTAGISKAALTALAAHLLRPAAGSVSDADWPYSVGRSVKLPTVGVRSLALSN
jgi:hypothetical protein